MEQDSYYFRVGVFVGSALILFVAVIAWFASRHDEAGHTPYVIYFNGAVDGLVPGSPVKLRGIQVGFVEQISFASKQDDSVRVLIQVLDEAPVRLSTMASLQMQGLTGGAMIALENTDQNKAPPKYRDKDNYLIITSRPSSLEKVFTSVPELLEQLTRFAVQGQKMLGDDNINAVHESLGSVSTALQSLTGLIGGQKGQSIQETFASLNEMITEAKIALREMRMLARTLREDPSIVIHGIKDEGVKVQ